MTTDPPPDTPRRVRAAMAYGNVSRTDLADALGYSPATLDRITGGRSGQPRAVDWKILWRIADYCGVPREWFTCDIDRLYEIVPEGMPVFIRRVRRAAAEEASRLAGEAARRRESSETRTGEASRRPGSRRRSP